MQVPFMGASSALGVGSGSLRPGRTRSGSSGRRPWPSHHPAEYPSRIQRTSRGSVVAVLGRALVLGVTAIAGEHDLGARRDVQVAGGARPGSLRGDYDGSLLPAAPAVTETTAYKLSNNRPATPTRCTQQHASRNPRKAGSADLVDVEGDDDTAVNGIRALVGMDGAIGLLRGEPGGDDITRDRHDGQGVPCGRAEAADEAGV